ncbi:MAG TPA: outer membrane protein assembly factor BamC [Usitatibacter sp.]|nr:outer membrane protein assembly factor BamC [Usitatibacter sp.]
MTFTRITLGLAIAAVASGCSWFNTRDEYKGAAARRAQPLEVPPELSRPQAEDRYAIPDPKAQTTYSQYTQRGNAPVVPGAPDARAVLPKIEGARMERQGDQRWLVVKGDPAAVWPVTREFWAENGYQLVKEEANTGILETEWYEDKSKIPQDLMRRTVGKVVPNLWSTPRRDKYRTRLEKGSEYGTTEIFISNRNVEEIFADANQDRTVWQSRPADKDAEAEMLQKLLVKIGTAQAVAQAEAQARKSGTQVASTSPTAASTAPAERNAVLEGNQLTVNDSFDRAWRRVGLALDRVGFTVEDRDRTKGLFYVRYVDPEKDASQPRNRGDEGFFDKLKFWKSDTKDKLPQYRVYVADAGASMSQVVVQNSQGQLDQSNTSKRILNLLYDQLK